MLRPQRASSDGPGLRAGRAVPEVGLAAPEVRRASSLPERLAADIEALDETMRRILSLHHQTPRPSYNLSLPPALAREGWTIEWSRRRARWYYFNKQTNASTWEQPVVPKKTVRRFAARPGAPPPSSSRDRAQEAELAFRFQYPEPWFREGVRPRGAPPAAAEQSAPAPPANPGQIWPRMEMVPGRSGMELQQKCAVCFAPLNGRVCVSCGQRYALSPPRPAADDVRAVDAFLPVDGAGEAVEQWDQLRAYQVDGGGHEDCVDYEAQVDGGGHEDCVDYEALRNAESRARDPHAERQREIDIYNEETATNADSERRAALAHARVTRRDADSERADVLAPQSSVPREGVRTGMAGSSSKPWRGRSGTGLADPSLRQPEPRVLRVSNVPQRRDRGGGGGGDEDEDEDGGGGDEDLRALCSRYGWIEALEICVGSTDPVGTVWVLTMGERAAANALLAAARRGELVLQGQRLEVQPEESPECVMFGGEFTARRVVLADVPDDYVPVEETVTYPSGYVARVAMPLATEEAQRRAERAAEEAERQQRAQAREDAEMALWEAMRQKGMRWSEFTRRGGALQRGRDVLDLLGCIPTAASEGTVERTFERQQRELREWQAAVRAERKAAARAERRKEEKEEEALQRRLYEGPLPHFLLDRQYDEVPAAAHAERQRKARRAQARDERTTRDEPRQARIRQARSGAADVPQPLPLTAAGAASAPGSHFDSDLRKAIAESHLTHQQDTARWQASIQSTHAERMQAYAALRAAQLAPGAAGSSSVHATAGGGAAGPSGVAPPRAVLPRRQASREAAACQEGARPQKLARTAAAAAEEDGVDEDDDDDDDDWVLLDTSPPDEIVETATAAGATSGSGLARHIPRAAW